MKKVLVSLSLFLLVVLAACNGNGGKQGAGNAPETAQEDSLKYAQVLQINRGNGYDEVVVKNPWKNGVVLQKYILVSRDGEMPENLPEGTVVKVPLQRAVVYSSVHAGVMKEVSGSYDAIAGITDRAYFNVPEIEERVQQGLVADCGSSMSPTVEKIVELEPDAIILSPFENAGYGPLTTLGIPILECADYMEATPLGRAEWVKFFGLLTGCEQKAAEIFAQVEKDYNELKAKTVNVEKRPKIVTESVSNGVWYVPGGKSYMAQIFKDAGADYPWKDTEDAGSIQLDFAQVFDKAHDADFWLVKTFGVDVTKDYMIKSYKLNGEMDALNNGGLYYCNTMTSSLYADFPFHPEVLLRDMTAIFHPELMQGYTQKYYIKAK